MCVGLLGCLLSLNDDTAYVSLFVMTVCLFVMTLTVVNHCDIPLTIVYL